MTSSEAERSRAEIRPTKQRVELDLLARPDVTGVDINYKTTKGRMTDRMAIVVSVKKKKSKSSLKADELIPKEIDGIPTDVIEEEIVLHRPALAEVETQIDKSTYATLEGGISMGPCRSVYLEPPDVPTAGYYIFVGTLGVFVRDRTSHDVMALTNFHVACIDTGWKVGDTMTQPGRVDGGSCPAGQFGTLQRAVLSEHVDGAVVGLDAGKSWKCAIAEIGSVQGKMTASVGMAVRKRGRTTELTYGKVTSVDYSTSIDYGDGLGTHILKEQIRVDVDTAKSTQFGDHGDSGSAVVEARQPRRRSPLRRQQIRHHGCREPDPVGPRRAERRPLLGFLDRYDPDRLPPARNETGVLQRAHAAPGLCCGEPAVGLRIRTAADAGLRRSPVRTLPTTRNRTFQPARHRALQPARPVRNSGSRSGRRPVLAGLRGGPGGGKGGRGRGKAGVTAS